MASVNISTSDSPKSMGSIKIGSTNSISKQWETYTYSVLGSEISDLLNLFGLPPIPITPIIDYYVSFMLFKRPFIFKGSDIFNNFQGSGGYSLDGINKLDEEILYKYKFYVYCGMNTLTWEQSFFGSGYPHSKSDLWGLMGIDTDPTLGVDLTVLRYKDFDPFSKEWKNILNLFPQMVLHFPNLLGISLLSLQKRIGGEYKKRSVSSGEFEYIIDPDIYFNCFKETVQSVDYRYTFSNISKFDNHIGVYDIFNIPSYSYWCPEYVLPWVYMIPNSNLQSVSVQVSIPILLSLSSLNVLTCPGVPIVAKYTIPNNWYSNYGQNIYFIFPLIDAG